MSDVVGSEGIIMELAVCDMLKAITGASDPTFRLSHQIRWAHGAPTTGMHAHGRLSVGFSKLDHK